MVRKSAGERALLPLTENQELSYPSDQQRLLTPRVEFPRVDVARGVQVRDIMTERVVTVPRSASLHEVTRRMRAFHVSGLPVVDGRGHVAGIVTETDVARVLGEKLGMSPLGVLLHETPLPLALQDEATLNRYRETLSRAKVKDVMSPDPVTIFPEASVEEAIRLMREERVNRLPVVKDGKLVGIVARQDLLAALLPT